MSTFNDLVAAGEASPRDLDPLHFSWSDGRLADLKAGRTYSMSPSFFTTAMYRPFSIQNLYFDRSLVDRPGRLVRSFPTARTSSVGLFVTAPGESSGFSTLIVTVVPDLHLIASGQFFPRHTFEQLADEDTLFGGSADTSNLTRVDNITESALQDYRASYGAEVSKDDIFYYVYGLLHSTTYRIEFAADLKKMLPRIPKVKDFARFVEAGRKLADLHLNYETVEPYPLEEVGEGSYRVQKMAFGKEGKDKDKSAIVYNSAITLKGIPEDAYRYMLGSRSAIEWIMDRYQVKTDKASGIVNDPNDWADEHNEPRYIIDLVKRIVTVSLETMKIVDSLPALDIIE